MGEWDSLEAGHKGFSGGVKDIGGKWALYGCRPWDKIYTTGRLQTGKSYVWGRCRVHDGHMWGAVVWSALFVSLTELTQGPSSCYINVECDPNDPNVGDIAAAAVR